MSAAARRPRPAAAGASSQDRCARTPRSSPSCWPARRLPPTPERRPRAGSARPRRGAQPRPSATAVPDRRRRAASPDARPHQARDSTTRRRCATPLLDARTPTFRTSVTERVDIWRFWGEPDEVAAYVRPSGGSWHHEFQDMVTPDEYKGYGGILGNGEKLQLAATSLAFAGAMKLLGIGVQQAKGALHSRTVRKAKEEVQRELEAFYQLHPEARPAAPTPPYDHGRRRRSVAALPAVSRREQRAQHVAGPPGPVRFRVLAAGDLAVVQVAAEAPAVAQQDVLQHARVMEHARPFVRAGVEPDRRRRGGPSSAARALEDAPAIPPQRRRQRRDAPEDVGPRQADLERGEAAERRAAEAGRRGVRARAIARVDPGLELVDEEARGRRRAGRRRAAADRSSACTRRGDRRRRDRCRPGSAARSAPARISASAVSSSRQSWPGTKARPGSKRFWPSCR